MEKLQTNTVQQINAQTLKKQWIEPSFEVMQLMQDTGPASDGMDLQAS